MQEAQNLRSRLESQAPVLTKETRIELGRISRDLLQSYKDSADQRYFNSFYSLTQGLFGSIAVHILHRNSYQGEAEEILARMYLLLYERLLEPGGKVPLDYLLPWCYRVILNLAREEHRKSIKTLPLPQSAVPDPRSSSLMERLIEREEEQRNQDRFERILDHLYSEKSGLSARDRTVMRRFYLEGWSMKKISRTMGLTQANVGVILMRSRKRITKLLSKGRSLGSD